MVTNCKKSLFLIFTLLFSINIFCEEPEEEPVTEPELPPVEEIVQKQETEEVPELTAEAEIVNSEEQTEQTDEAETSGEQIEKPEYVTIPYSDRQEVEKFRQQYLNPKWQNLLRSDLEAAMEYRLYVRKALKDRDMPFYLEYLPMVESNYKTTARSRSGALGMWQFMENSVKPFLTLNDFVDERLDPWKSTDAALTKLMDNYRYFGDWMLAIGAYNCGAGAMAKAIKKAGSRDYWYLVEHKFLSVQTSQYVPKLLAIAELAENSEYYDLDLPDHKEEYDLLYNETNAVFDYVTVKKAYSISQLSREMRIDTSTLKALNPSFVKGMTHPAKESQIRVPSGMAAMAEEALKKLTPIDFPFKYTVVAGDSLWSISRKFGVTVSSICDTNDIKENDILKIGKILYIPSK